MKKADHRSTPESQSNQASTDTLRLRAIKPESASPISRKRLESWKQIADYLQCSERTARRYQSKGLPVYRLAALDKQRVFAYSDELNHWLHEGGQTLLKDKDIQQEVSDTKKPDSLSPNFKPTRESAEIRLLLEVVEGTESGSHYLMHHPLIILGRDVGATVVFSDLRISRRHAQIARRGSDFILEDLGSRNGTSLNGKALKTPKPLRQGDRIGLGKAVFLQVRMISTAETLEADRP